MAPGQAVGAAEIALAHRGLDAGAARRRPAETHAVKRAINADAGSTGAVLVPLFTHGAEHPELTGQRIAGGGAGALESTVGGIAVVCLADRVIEPPAQIVEAGAAGQRCRKGVH